MQGVVTDGTQIALWIFDAPVTYVSGTVPALELDAGGGGFLTPTAVTQFAADTLSVEYSNGCNTGDSWRMLSQPTGVAEAALVIVPENGLCL